MTSKPLHSSKLQLQGIWHDFGGKALFDGIDLTVSSGDVVAILGASGVGKTTLFNIAAGLIKPKSGQVLVDGQDITGQAGHVGYMLQKDLLLPFKRVYDNIALPLILQGQSRQAIEAAILPKLAVFGLEDLYQRYPQELSGGQRQRAALLRTYLSNDNLMLLDEPFSALDFVTKHHMHQWFGEFQKNSGLTCLIITHDIDEALVLANHVYVLKGFPAQLSHHFVSPSELGFADTTDYLTLKKAVLSAISD